MKKEHAKKKKGAGHAGTGIAADENELKSAVLSAFAPPLSKDEQGAAQVARAAAYLDTACAILERQKAELQAMLDGFQEVAKMEREFDEAVSLAKTRAELGGA